jgi:hypothetical protein
LFINEEDLPAILIRTRYQLRVPVLGNEEMVRVGFPGSAMHCQNNVSAHFQEMLAESMK